MTLAVIPTPEINSELEEQANNRIFDHSAFNEWQIKIQIQNRDNLKRIAEAVETLAKAWR